MNELCYSNYHCISKLHKEDIVGIECANGNNTNNSEKFILLKTVRVINSHTTEAKDTKTPPVSTTKQ